MAMLCLVVATSGACSFVEELSPGDAGYQEPNAASAHDTGGSTGGGTDTGTGTGSSGGGSGGGGSEPVVPAVVPYTARWQPAPSASSAGVVGYELDVDVSGGGNYRTIDIPVSAATSLSGGRLSFAIDLETRNDYVLTLRAYSSDATSAPSNAIIVYGSQLIANASSSGGASAALASPSAAMASSGGSSASSQGASDPTTTSSDIASDDGGGTRPDAALVDGNWLSLELDGNGAHLAGAIDDRLDGSALTLSTWLRPLYAGSESRRLFSSIDEAGMAGIEVSIVDGNGVSVSLRDASGGVVVEGVFANVLEHDVWQHVALIVDPAAASPVRIVTGGAVLEPISLDAAAGFEVPSVLTGALRIGGAEGDAGYVGRVGHTALFTRALALDELDLIDLRGHAIDLRSDLAADPTGEQLLHYWRLGEGDGVEADLGASAWPADLVATDGGVFAVEDAPLPIE